MENKDNKSHVSGGHRLNAVNEKTALQREFHEICRVSLFKQTEDEYIPEIVDSYYPQPAQRTELLLSFNHTSIGTIAIDDFGNGKAALRMVAIHPEHQRLGHGRMLLNLAEDFASERGIGQLCVNANPDAAGFYGALGFTEGIWSEKEQADCRTKSAQQPVVQMFKDLKL